MFLVGLISWWYGRGWVGRSNLIASRLGATLEFFSIGQLLGSLFSPYRQISASPSGDSSLGSVFRSFVDQLISRVIGAFVRLFTVLIGIIAITLQSIFEGLVMLVWWFVPIMPILGFMLLAVGWVPTWM